MKAFLFTLVFGAQLAFGCSPSDILAAAAPLPWHHGLDFDDVERRLLTSEVKTIRPIGEHLNEMGKAYTGDAEVFFIELADGTRGIAKPEDELWSSIAERSAYQLCREVGLKLMAPTVIRAFPELGNRAGSFQLYVDSPFNQKRRSDRKKALALISKKDQSDLILFQFLLGRWDVHPENILIDASGAPLLHDVEEIHFLQQIKYGDFPYIRRFLHKNGIRKRPFDFSRFPFEEEKQLTHGDQIGPTFLNYFTLQTIGNLLAKYQKGFFPEGRLRYVLWDQSVWIYWPRKNQSPLHTTEFSQATLSAFSSLNYEILAQKLPAPFSERHHRFILERRDQILNASKTGAIFP